ncbi:membrane protein [Bacteroidia bacterium]|nr:membrane protein [Bacteroidia bacterium]
MKNIFKYTWVVAGLILAFAACEDFLDTKPLDKMVEEDFWKTRSDVQSVLLASYEAMTSDDFMERIMIGGEFRSDNVQTIKGRTDQKLIDIMNVNVQVDNDLLKWKTFYTIINYCNRVLDRAPKIRDIDPDYTAGMLEVDLGEARAIRALAYFYLVRIYRDVPYIDFPYDDDTQPFQIEQTPGDELIDHIIADLKQAENEVVVTHGSGFAGSQMRQYTKGRFTKSSVRALLADALLWKASGLPEGQRAETYQQCVDVCTAIENSIYSVEAFNLKQDLDGSELVLIPNRGEGIMGEGSTSNSYAMVFYYENSVESLLEFQFDSRNSNTKVPFYYGRVGEAAHVYASPLVDAIFEGPADVRHYDSFHQTGGDTKLYYIDKYVSRTRISNEPADYNYKTEANAKLVNWILYRVPDVNFMKAEALIELGSASDLTQALMLISQIFERSNPGAAPLSSADYPTQSAMRALLLLERRREFLFEGKRWFDLVRMARREGNSLNLASFVSQNATLNSDVIKTKLSVPDALYLPIHRNELVANGLLKQNPYYDKNKTNK